MSRICSSFNLRGQLVRIGRQGILLTLLAVLLPWTVARAQSAATEREYAVKAAFLFHFTQFIVWPPEAMPRPGEPIRIGVLGSDSIGKSLEAIVQGQEVEGHRIEVLYPKRADVAASCQILFIPAGAADAQREALASLGSRPVLLVGEDRAFVQAGGMIALVREQERVAIVINQNALNLAGLSASSRLLRLAQVIGSHP